LGKEGLDLAPDRLVGVRGHGGLVDLQALRLHRVVVTVGTGAPPRKVGTGQRLYPSGQSSGVRRMQFWDFTRSPASVQLLLAAGAERGLRAPDLLRGSGLTQARLADAEISIDAAQEVAVIRNLLALAREEAGLGLLVGLRYHATAYGVLGLGLLSAPSGLD